MSTPATNPLKILLTGAGSPGICGTVYALRHNPDGAAVRIVGTDTRKEAVGQYFIDSFYVVPQPEDASYLEVVADICQREQVSLLIPQTTRESVRLSQDQHLLAAAGVRVMIAEARALERANSKWLLLQHAEKLQLPVPTYAIARSEEELIDAVSGLGYPRLPVVVKPPNSNGMRGVRVLREAAWDAKRFLNEKPSGLEICLDDLVGILRRGDSWPALLVSEYLPGPEYSVDVFIGKTLQLAIPRLRAEIRSGITFSAQIDTRADLVEYSIRAALGLGLTYTCGFQFKLDANGIPKLLECNPRIQGTMVASVFSGPNVIWLGVKEVLGECPTCAPSVIEDTSFQRYWGGVGIRGADVKQI